MGHRSITSQQHQHTGGQAYVTLDSRGKWALVCTGCGTDKQQRSEPAAIAALLKHVGRM